MEATEQSVFQVGEMMVEPRRRAYRFLVEHERSEKPFTPKDVQAATGWKAATVKTYISKKWFSFLEKNGNEYIVRGISKLSENDYLRLMSQSDREREEVAVQEPLEIAELLARKARESATLALDIYNRPATVFRTQGFTIMMNVAWTSLFHAIFEKQGTDYFYYNKDGTPEIIDSDHKAWDLQQSMKKYFGGSVNPIESNLRFFIGLRNKIVHRYAPAIDPDIAGECQRLLLNFDELIVEKFGEQYAIREALTMPLLTSNVREGTQMEAVRKFQGKHYQEIKEYINTFRSNLPDTIHQDPAYSFRVWLVPKIGNHASTSDAAIEFVKYDSSNPEQMELYENQVALIRERQVQVANQGRFRASDVAKAVKEKIGRLFSVSHHVRAWKYYDVRKRGYQAEGCNAKYCQFDTVHNSYIYTQEWIDFLVRKLSDEQEYLKVINYKG